MKTFPGRKYHPVVWATIEDALAAQALSDEEFAARVRQDSEGYYFVGPLDIGVVSPKEKAA